MDNNKTDYIGNLHISQDVVASIARTAALEVDGVSSVSMSKSGVRGLFNRSNYAKPIKIEIVDDVASIEISIIVKSGTNIPQVADAIQQNVKNSIQNMTGLAVARVDIVICGLSQEKASE